MNLNREDSEGGKDEGSTSDRGLNGTQLPQQFSADDQFRIQEFIELRREILSGTEETRKLERFCLIGVAAMFSWIATQAPTPIFQSNLYVAVLVPPLLVLFGWVKCFAIEANIQEIGVYIAELEKRMLPQGEGWENFYASIKPRRWILPELVSGRFWPLLFIVTCGTSLILIRDTPLGKRFWDLML